MKRNSESIFRNKFEAIVIIFLSSICHVCLLSQYEKTTFWILSDQKEKIIFIEFLCLDSTFIQDWPQLCIMVLCYFEASYKAVARSTLYE